MKNLVFSILLAFLSTCLFSQSADYYVKINHKLLDEVFEINESAENNLSNRFMFTRLEYYLSGFSLVSDNGLETMVEDTWSLIDASESTSTLIYLGNHDLTDITGINFHIGVDPEHNHLDPTIWPSEHPLAPQFPSMHWGWASGYRFVALEGMGGDDLDQLFQLHGLGDNNYLKAEISASPIQEGSDYIIELNANYEAALANIRLNNGMIIHGDDQEAQLCIGNFQKFVFEQADVTSSSTEQFQERIAFYPNPASDRISIQDENDRIESYRIIGIDGKLVKHGKVDSEIDISELAPGQYIIYFFDRNSMLDSDRLSIIR